MGSQYWKFAELKLATCGHSLRNLVQVLTVALPSKTESEVARRRQHDAQLVVACRPIASSI